MAKIHLKNVIFSFTPIKIKLYTMKAPMKSKTFCITSLTQITQYWSDQFQSVIVSCKNVDPKRSKKIRPRSKFQQALRDTLTKGRLPGEVGY